MADMKQQIKQRQSQSLHMTSQLRSAIKMLEIPSPELHNYLSLLCLDNPLLSVESPEESIASYDLDQYDMDDYNESADFQDGWHPIKSDDLNANSLSDNKNHIKTLRQHVCEFIELNVTNTVEKIIAYFLLDNLDSNGYLKVDLESIEKTIGSDDNMAARVLHMMQAIEPTGLFARDLCECLRLQFLDFGWELDNLEKFFKHKDLFTAGNFVAFKKKAEIDDIGLNNLIKQMRKCNPKPGQDFVDDISCYAIADLIFSLDGDCNVFVQLNSKAQPKLTIDESLFEKALRGDPSYARAKRTDAMWIMSAMRQRAENLQKLGNTIVNHQRDFFVHGISHMRPMTLKQVAIETGLHESTVSRLTLDKFASTPFGLIHMKNFFSASLKNISNDDDVSAKSVQKTLKDLIESEDPEHIYSDDALVFELAQRGISISRRTIAKYRDVLKIPSSYERARMSKTNRFFINSLG